MITSSNHAIEDSILNKNEVPEQKVGTNLQLKWKCFVGQLKNNHCKMITQVEFITLYGI
jgi:hypothetical protein